MNLVIETCAEDKESYDKQIEEIKTKLVKDTLYTDENVDFGRHFETIMSKLV